MPLAQVIEIDNENETTTLRLLDNKVCEDCESLACGLQSRDEVKVALRPQLDLKTGDTVVVEEEGNSLWAAGSLLFVLPLVLFIAGTSIGYYGANYFHWRAAEIIGFIGGIVLILVSLPLIRLGGNYLAADSESYTIKALHTPADTCPNN